MYVANASPQKPDVRHEKEYMNLFRKIFGKRDKQDPANMMKTMRLEWLQRPPTPGSYKTDDDVVAVLMDWPIGDNIATVLASSLGDASLYTSSTFGIIGGIGHEKVRNAALQFAQCAQHFLHITHFSTDYGYPDGNKIKISAVTPKGVRSIVFEMKDVEDQNSPAYALFACGQIVLTELRLTMPDQKEN